MPHTKRKTEPRASWLARASQCDAAGRRRRRAGALPPDSVGRGGRALRTLPTVPNDDHRLHILLVEDDADSRAALRRLLSARRYAVHAAEDCRSALEVLARQPIDVLVSDFDLPDGDGCEVMEVARRLYGAPGIAVTGYTSEDVRVRCLAAGFVAVLTKPVAFETLVKAVGDARPRDRR